VREIRESIRAALAGAARSAFDLETVEVPLDYTPNAELGDLASPLAFGLARVLRRAPREIASRIAEEAGALPLVSRIEVAGAGYLNLFLDRTAVLHRLLARSSRDPAATGAKVVVEHTNINPNKAAHIGHLRNAVLGDTLVRCLRALGRPVEVQNYIDDTGVQVADLVVGFRELERLGLEELRERERVAEERRGDGGNGFDYDCWDLYARVTSWYEEDPSREGHRRETLHAMERGEGPAAEMAAFLAPRMVRAHLRTMARLGIAYHLLPKESDILAHGFWKETFERLRDSGAIRYVEEGDHAGCWVMDLPEEHEGEEREKILVRSNGTVTYTGKDIAYQLWKLGLSGRDFEYRPFPLHQPPGGEPLWETSTGQGEPGHPSFGGGETVYNVIDRRQAYPQKVVAEGVRLLGFPEEARRSIHFAYEMVSLSPRAAEALVPGLSLSEEERGRAAVEMSGRRGLGVKADDLIDTLEEKAREAVAANDPGLAEEERRERARQIAVGALRYYMLRTTCNRKVVFDLDDALSFQGETGPYLAYAVVRIGSIFERLAEAGGPDEEGRDRALGEASFDAVEGEDSLPHWEIVARCGRLEDSVESAVENLEPAHLARFAFELARLFSSFYQAKGEDGRTRFPVVQESDPGKLHLRLALAELVRRTLRRALDLMGIPVPRRM
jgi:arginyl-tRNA synthetase